MVPCISPAAVSFLCLSLLDLRLSAAGLPASCLLLETLLWLSPFLKCFYFAAFEEHFSPFCASLKGDPNSLPSPFILLGLSLHRTVAVGGTGPWRSRLHSYRKIRSDAASADFTTSRISQPPVSLAHSVQGPGVAPTDYNKM